MKIGIGLVLQSGLGAHLPSPHYRELRNGTGPSGIRFSAFRRTDNENPSLAASFCDSVIRPPTLRAEVSGAI